MDSAFDRWTFPVVTRAADDTFAAVRLYVKVVEVTDLTEYVPLNVASTSETAMTSPTRNPCGVAVVKVATLLVNALLVTRIGDPMWTNESIVRPAIVNSFVKEFWFVPHLIRTPVTAVLTDVGHFNATERTPAVAVN
jgi:hypothetical protein